MIRDEARVDVEPVRIPLGGSLVRCENTFKIPQTVKVRPEKAQDWGVSWHYNKQHHVSYQSQRKIIQFCHIPATDRLFLILLKRFIPKARGIARLLC